MGNLPFALVIVLGFILLVVVVFLLVLPIWFMITAAKKLNEISETCKSIELKLNKPKETKETKEN